MFSVKVSVLPFATAPEPAAFTTHWLLPTVPETAFESTPNTAAPPPPLVHWPMGATTLAREACPAICIVMG